MAKKYHGVRMNPSKFHRDQIKFYFIFIPIAVIMAFPILYIFTTAFKPYDELFAFPQKFWVYEPTLNNFKMLFSAMSDSSIPMTRYLLNTTMTTLLVIMISVILSVSAGYALSKKDFKFKNVIFEINTLAMMFVAAAVNIPRFIIISKLGLYDKFLINILPLVAMPVGLFLLKQFIDQIPDSLIEAAKIDGAGDFVILRKIILPMVAPALATVVILAFQSAWGNVDISNLYISDDSIKSFAYYLNSFSSSATGVAGTGMAAVSTLIMFVPNLIVFLIAQSRVMDTMAHSGIK